ncbi:hypothetical protein [Microbacterium plantarum]|uniref:hypothetical protein n=1 Tax=Microbacterium plantarum TaxID=1816425 RepID=UPI0023673084|nr:hypothetical protein [Microbacterium plantarum]
MPLSDSDIAYWGACAAVAPVLGLAVVLEARYLRSVREGGARWAKILVGAMYLLAGTASVMALGISLSVLREGEVSEFSRALVPHLLTYGWGLVITSPLVAMLTDSMFEGPRRAPRKRRGRPVVEAPGVVEGEGVARSPEVVERAVRPTREARRSRRRRARRAE